MARTTLAGRFQQMAGRFRAADALGLDPAEVAAMSEQEIREGLSRRGLLKGAAVLAGAVAFGELPGVVGRTQAANAPRVAIVGAGISGLAAALRLQDSGVKSMVYEANTRIGGRMFSNTTRWASGQVSE
jgi:monoamine oxidase